MEHFDWMQFESLAIIFIGVYLIFEILRFVILQAITVYGGKDNEKIGYRISNLFSIFRLILIAAFFITFIFTAVFNQQTITNSDTNLNPINEEETLSNDHTEKLETEIAVQNNKQ